MLILLKHDLCFCFFFAIHSIHLSIALAQSTLAAITETTESVADKKYKLISHSFAVRKGQYQRCQQAPCLERARHLVHGWHLLLVSSQGGREQGNFLPLFYRVNNSWRLHPYHWDHLCKDPPPNIFTLRVRISIYGLCCCSVAKSCATLCDPMDCSMPGFFVLHYLLESAQIHVHWVSDAI